MTERPNLPDPEMLRTWEVGGFVCKLWRQDEVVLRGCVFQDSQPIACAEVLAESGEDTGARAVEALIPGLQPRIENLDGVPVTDIVLVLRSGETPVGEPALCEPFDVAEDVQVIRVSRGIAQMVMAACDPPGENRGSQRIDLRDPLYVIQRVNAPRPPLHGWDSDERLQRCIALSRLVRPTSIGFEYAVRMLGDLRDRYELIPGPVHGFGANAWTSAPKRDWLSLTDLREWQALVTAGSANPLPARSRVARALWYLEYAARTQLVDIRWTLVTTAVESLVCTNTGQSTRHFTKRLPLLAQHFGMPSITSDEASRMWGLRSALTHGSRHGGLDEDDFALYGRMEDVARVTVHRAIVDPATRAIFETGDRIDVAFPVPDPALKTLTCPTCNTIVPVTR